MEKIKKRIKEKDLYMDYNRINDRVKSLQDKGLVNPHFGTAKPSEPVQIESTANHAFRHGITREQAQLFINTSEVMFDQGNRNMYLSKDGSATVIVEKKRLISAYGKEDFDNATKAVLEVINDERHKR